MKHLRHPKYMLFACIFMFVLPTLSQEEKIQEITEEVVPGGEFSQESTIEQIGDRASTHTPENKLAGNSGRKLDLSGYLFVNNNLFGEPYKDESGLSVSYKRAKEIVSMVPGNEALLRQERRLRIASNVSFGSLLFFGIILPFSTYNVAINYASEEEIPILAKLYNGSIVIAAFSFSGTILFGQASKLKFQRSVDNYNYYITRPER